MDTEKRTELISRNTAEILTKEDLLKLVKEKKDITAYNGLTVTGPFHMGYFVPFGKLIDFENAGIKIKIFVADIHSALDDLKAPWDELKKRSDYFKKCIELGFPWKKTPEFRIGSEHQFDRKYSMDMFKLTTMTTVKRAMRAASEVTRMKNPKVSELIYPIMQSLDEEYLDVDIQLGGIDQRHILALAREVLPLLGYQKRVEIMTPLVAGLKGPGAKMSASIPETHIKVHDSEEKIKKNIRNAYCPEGIIKDNPILQLCRYVIFPVRGKIRIVRDKKFGGDLEFKMYSELEKIFIDKKLHPLDLKNQVSAELVSMFTKVRKHYEKHRDQLEELGKNYL